jgi:hypothetical protein
MRLTKKTPIPNREPSLVQAEGGLFMWRIVVGEKSLLRSKSTVRKSKRGYCYQKNKGGRKAALVISLSVRA